MISFEEVKHELLQHVKATYGKAADNALESAIEKRIKDLQGCGLESGKICVNLIAKQLSSSNGKVSLTAAPAKLRCELYDKVNYMCRSYMDRMERIELEYPFTVDEKAFKTAVIGLFETAPIFHSRLIKNPVSPYWRPMPYKIDDVVTCSKDDYSLEKSEAFMAQELSLDGNLQLKIHLFYHDGKTNICYLTNHMCTDGIAFFTFITDICRNYTRLIESGTSPTDYKNGSRSFQEVYTDMDKATKKKAKKMLSNIAPKIKCDFPYTAEAADDKPILARHKISAEKFKPALAAAKARSCSGNDLLLAAYMAAYKEVANAAPDTPLNVTTAINLRRHIKNPERLGYTNHISFFNCTVDKVGSDVSETLAAVSKATQPMKTDKLIGLSGLPLLDFAYKSMVYIQAEQVIKLFYSNPSLSVSNLGVVDKVAFSLSGNAPTDIYASGATKHKPCAVMTCASLNGDLSVAISFYGNSRDREIVEHFFDCFENKLIELAQ